MITKRLFAIALAALVLAVPAGADVFSERVSFDRGRVGAFYVIPIRDQPTYLEAWAIAAIADSRHHWEWDGVRIQSRRRNVGRDERWTLTLCYGGGAAGNNHATAGTCVLPNEIGRWEKVDTLTGNNRWLRMRVADAETLLRFMLGPDCFGDEQRRHDWRGELTEKDDWRGWGTWEGHRGDWLIDEENYPLCRVPEDWLRKVAEYAIPPGNRNVGVERFWERYR